MILEQELARHLKENLSANVYAQVRGEDLPAVVYRLDSDEVRVSINGTDQVREPRIQIICYSSDYFEAKKLSVQVIDSLHKLTGLLGDFPIQLILLENREDTLEDETDIHQLSLLFVVYHN